MKLIYANGACSLSIHIMLEELGRKYESINVSLQDKTVLETFNEKSYVPALVLDDGTILTEAISILQYLADVNHRSDLLPDVGTIARAKTIEWSTFLTTELHKGFGPFFMRDKLGPEFRTKMETRVDQRLGFLDKNLKGKKFIMGDDFTIADMYAIAILRIGDHVKMDYTKFPEIVRYKRFLEQMPVIRKVIDAEKATPVTSKAA